MIYLPLRHKDRVGLAMSGPLSAIFLCGSHVEFLGQAIFEIPTGSMQTPNVEWVGHGQ
jgi:hypothetical protein